MQNATSIYNFNNHKIRTKLFDGKIHFCGKDVCEAISIKNSKDTMSRLKEGVVITDLPTVGGVQQAKFINEPNLYKIVLQSRKPQAEPFVNWVCSEVLPSIRQTGGYVAPNGKAVVVSEHTRALPSGKKEIVLSEKAKEEVGGIVKAVVRSELNELLTNPDKSESWEVSDHDLLYWLQNWHLTRNKADTLKFQQLTAENEELKRRLSAIKQAVN